MRRWLMLTLAVSLLAGCDKAGTGSQSPGDDTSALERMESSPTANTSPAGAQGEGNEGDKPLPKVQDRDPEEEKRKMAASRAKSAQAVQKLRAGQIDQAVMASRAALKIHEQNVEAMLVIAEAFFRQKKFELTLAVTNSIMAVDPKVRTPQETGKANNLRGFAHAAMGNDQAATQAFKKAAEADEKNAAAWNNLGTRYLDAGDARTAVSCFTYAVELEPRFAKAHMNLGAAYRAQREWKKAEASLQKALSLEKNYPEAYFNLGLLYLDADPFPGLETKPRLQKAIAYLNKYKSSPSGKDAASMAEASGRSRTVRGRPGAKPGPPPVSSARADDYIRVAQKGIEREDRRLEREAKRKAKGGGATGGSEAKAPQKPGSEPAASQPDPEPAQPEAPKTEAPKKEPPPPPKETPQAPSGPKPQGPGAKPQAPQGPSQPKQQPQAPQQPQQPKPQQPKPQQPKPQQPSGPKPQAPGQRSSGTDIHPPRFGKSDIAGNPRDFADTKVRGHAMRARHLVVRDETGSLGFGRSRSAPGDTP